jgi:hypothetical protein
VTPQVERLGPGSKRAFDDTSLERMHGGRRDPVGNDSQLGLAVDLRYGIDQLEVLRCIHDAPMTGDEERTAVRARSNRRAVAWTCLTRGTVRQSYGDFIVAQIDAMLKGV